MANLIETKPPAPWQTSDGQVVLNISGGTILKDINRNLAGVMEC